MLSGYISRFLRPLPFSLLFIFTDIFFLRYFLLSSFSLRFYAFAGFARVFIFFASVFIFCSSLISAAADFRCPASSFTIIIFHISFSSHRCHDAAARCRCQRRQRRQRASGSAARRLPPLTHDERFSLASRYGAPLPLSPTFHLPLFFAAAYARRFSSIFARFIFLRQAFHSYGFNIFS